MSADLCHATECAERNRAEMLQSMGRGKLPVVELYFSCRHLLDKHEAELSSEEKTELVTLANAAALLCNWTDVTAARAVAREAAQKLGEAEEHARGAEERYRHSIARVEGEGWKA